MGKRYFENEDACFAYSEDYFKDQMRDEGLTEMTVLEAIPMKSSEIGYMWCKKSQSAGVKGECGRECLDYEPRNGKSGMCKNQGRFFMHGDEVTLKLQP